jgi:methyltransferase (TIGR00027 family)
MPGPSVTGGARILPGSRAYPLSTYHACRTTASPVLPPMNNHPADAPPRAPLFQVDWDEDLATRLEPRAFTELLHEQVPVLDFVKWEVREVGRGSATSVLPLNVPSTNQHFTHQAALLVLAADYTGGIALASLFVGWPVLGVHPVKSRESVSMWLLKVDIKYLRPSTADLFISARIAPERHARLQRRFAEGRAVVETIEIEFRNGDTPVAEATAVYFARQSDRLRSDGVDVDSVNTLYRLRLTSSAELIAGVRARYSGHLFEDVHAERMAGQHGMALAARFCERTPQLGGMVAARTRHGDQAVLNFVRGGGRDIINVGVGWDMRAFRLDLPPGSRLYELDFPTTLTERRRRLAEHGVADRPGITRIEVPVDVRTMPLAEVLRPLLGGDRPLLLVWEGMSMYFDEAEVLRILQGMEPLMRHPGSLLWMDVVDREPIVHTERFPESVQAFMRGMHVLGEPFTFGTDSVEDFVSRAGLRSLEVVPSDAYLPDREDPVYSIYRFCLAGHAAHAAAGLPLTFSPTRATVRRRS